MIGRNATTTGASCKRRASGNGSLTARRQVPGKRAFVQGARAARRERSACSCRRIDFRKTIEGSSLRERRTARICSWAPPPRAMSESSTTKFGLGTPGLAVANSCSRTCTNRAAHVTKRFRVDDTWLFRFSRFVGTPLRRLCQIDGMNQSRRKARRSAAHHERLRSLGSRHGGERGLRRSGSCNNSYTSIDDS